MASGLPGDDRVELPARAQGTLWVGTNRCLARAIAAGAGSVCPAPRAASCAASCSHRRAACSSAARRPTCCTSIRPAGRPRSVASSERSERSDILALAIGPEGDLWIATQGRLVQAARRGARAARARRHPRAHADRPVRRRSLVVGDSCGPRPRRASRCSSAATWRLFDKPHGFLDSAMRYVIRRADGRLCVAYSEAVGVTCFRYATATRSGLRTHRGGDGLTSGHGVLPRRGPPRRLWIGTGDGVDVVTPGGVDHFDESDGLAGNDSAATAFLADGDGSLWLGATGGATHVLAQHYHGPRRAPRTDACSTAGSAISRSSAGATALEVPHDRNALTLEFASTSLLDAKRVEYQVRLSPLEVDWSATRQRQARYPALPPGATASRSARGSAPAPGAQTAELQFAVLPAWWQTRWFFLLVAAVGLLALALGFTWRQRAVLRRRTRQLNERSPTRASAR